MQEFLLELLKLFSLLCFLGVQLTRILVACALFINFLGSRIEILVGYNSHNECMRVTGHNRYNGSNSQNIYNSSNRNSCGSCQDSVLGIPCQDACSDDMLVNS